MSARRLRVSAVLTSTLALGVAAHAAGLPAISFNLEPFPDAQGLVATYSTSGRIDTRNPFFQSLGTNGRSCATCHVASQAMSISPPDIRLRFHATRGQDPLFAPVDGANCATARRNDPAAHSLLLGHGLIRVGLTIPANPQFTLSVVHDPYGCALTTNPVSGAVTASVYRRPLPSTNLGFLSTVMWDGRETLSALNSGDTFLANLEADLVDQAKSAVMIHAQGAAPSSVQLGRIVDFELQLYTAQLLDWSAGLLSARGANGGPVNLASQEYYPGANDSLGADPSGASFDSSSMAVFSAWASAGPHDSNWDGGAAARRTIAAGERLFNTAPLTITGVRGLNDNAALGKPASIAGTCTTCHDSPNIGNHSLPLPLDIGIGHSGLPNFESDPQIAAALREVDASDLHH